MIGFLRLFFVNHVLLRSFFFFLLESFSPDLELFTVVGFLVVVAVDLVAGIGVVDDDDDDGTVVVVVSSN